MTDELFKLAVNGTLMRGLALNQNLLQVGATFLQETYTEPSYRLWSIADQYPAMIRVSSGGVAIAVEVWQVPAAGLGKILWQEPPGLCIGKVRLASGEVVLGVLGEPISCEDQLEITQWGCWRTYQAEQMDPADLDNQASSNITPAPADFSPPFSLLLAR